MTDAERKRVFKSFLVKFREDIDQAIDGDYSLALMYDDISRMAGIIHYAQAIGVITHKESVAYISDIYNYRKEERLLAD